MTERNADGGKAPSGRGSLSHSLRCRGVHCRTASASSTAAVAAVGVGVLMAFFCCGSMTLLCGAEPEGGAVSDDPGTLSSWIQQAAREYGLKKGVGADSTGADDLELAKKLAMKIKEGEEASKLMEAEKKVNRRFQKPGNAADTAIAALSSTAALSTLLKFGQRHLYLHRLGKRSAEEEGPSFEDKAYFMGNALLSFTAVASVMGAAIAVIVQQAYKKKKRKALEKIRSVYNKPMQTVGDFKDDIGAAPKGSLSFQEASPGDFKDDIGAAPKGSLFFHKASPGDGGKAKVDVPDSKKGRVASSENPHVTKKPHMIRLVRREEPNRPATAST